MTSDAGKENCLGWAASQFLVVHLEISVMSKEEGQLVSSYVLKMKGYIDNLERLGHPVTLGLGVSLILIGLRKEYDGFVQNYNMHSMGKTVNELHAMLKLHQQILPKNNAPALNAIRAGKVQKGNKHKKSQSQMAARGQNHRNGKNKQAYAPKPKIPPPPKREDPAKDSISHECASGAGGSGIFVIELNTILNRSWIYDTGCGTHICNTTQGLRTSRKLKSRALSLYVDYALETAARILNMVPTKNVEKTPYEVWHEKAPKIPKETIGYSFYYLPENKVLVARNAEFLKNSLINQEASRSIEDLEIIQEEYMHPFIDTSLNHEEDDLEIDEPQSVIVPIHRSTRTRHAPSRMCLYIDDQEHELGDLGEPTNYKAALLDTEFEKWLNAMNVEMQSMKDNEVWVLVELPPNGKTVGSKWLFKKKTNMDGNVHTYKARLVAKGYTQTLGIDYEETFSPVADIRAIRILIAIVAYYDYEIWQIDVKTAFLNGYLNKEVYMEQPEGKAAYILGIKIYRDRSRRLISLCKSAYIEKILKRYCMKNSKRGSIPMQKKLKLSKSQEAEYITTFDASKEVVWVRKFISGLDVVPTIEEPISMYCDNTGAIAIANESGITKGARHFCAKVHYLQEVIEYGDIKLEKVHTDDNLADPFTKALAFLKHSEHTRNIRMLPASSLM
nr:hypothetical protein [Tanacetum cinerariifolium]